MQVRKQQLGLDLSRSVSVKGTKGVTLQAGLFEQERCREQGNKISTEKIPHSRRALGNDLRGP